MIADIVITTGCIFILISTLGIIRLPDTLSRIHAVSKITSFGLVLMILGVLIKHFAVDMLVKSIIIIVFLILTSPITAHFIARNLIQGDDE